MSYLVMPAAPVADTSKMIISFWVRDIKRTAGADAKPTQAPVDPPLIKQWPQEFWRVDNAKTTMVPPNLQYTIGNYDEAIANEYAVFYWNSYGLPLGGLAGAIFGGAFLGPQAVWIPNPPCMTINSMADKKDQGFLAAVGLNDASTQMSDKGIRTLLVFGDQNVDYKYCPWEFVKNPGDVIDAVIYDPASLYTGGPAGPGVPEWVAPYAPYLKEYLSEGRPPIGNGDGHLHPAVWHLQAPVTKFKMPPSFIAIDVTGHLIINLQCKETATYKGMSFQQTTMKSLWVHPTYLHLDGPPYTYTEIGWPFPDGHWVRRGEDFWNGYEFVYKDISQEIMGGAPESFFLRGDIAGIFSIGFGAVINDGGWHHILFSFDISGSVNVDQMTGNAITGCKAWLVVDDKKYEGGNMQGKPKVHDGWTLPKLKGTLTTEILQCGPTGSFNRAGPDDLILPRNAWLNGWNGFPRDGLIWNSSGANIVDDTCGDLVAYAFGLGFTGCSNDLAKMFGASNGDFDWAAWTGKIWPLYGHGIAPGPWQATYDPPRPTEPNPTTFATPVYNCPHFTIPLKGNPIGIPCSSRMEGNNTGVEMAELQIWVDQSLDVREVDNRRLFLDYPKTVDKDGTVTIKTWEPLQPVPPRVAAKKLGKPAILLHGSGNWKRGANTGTAGVNKETGQRDPAGNFQRVSKIEKFKPDPKLGR